MAHPGEIDIIQHPHGRIESSLDPVHVLKFPLTSEEVEDVQKKGGVVYHVSFGQKVIMENGARFAHGIDDGLDGDHAHFGPS